MSRKSNRVARFSGLALAGLGLAHFTSPRMWEPITKTAFPRNTGQHVYTNDGIETVLGLSFSSRQTRRGRPTVTWPAHDGSGPREPERRYGRSDPGRTNRLHRRHRRR
jgi:PAS domain-containing protein